MEAFVWFKPYLLMENKMIRTDIIKSINQILIKQAQEQKSKIAFSDIFSQISYIELDIKTSTNCKKHTSSLFLIFVSI